MPQASDEQRAEFGVDSSLAIKFLETRGFKLTDHFDWIPPVDHDVLTPKEIRAIVFLIDEWDFGDIEGQHLSRILN